MNDYKDKSFWLSSAEYQENPCLQEDIKADVAIVGGGFTGLTTAYFLKKEHPGLEVVLLESEVIGFGASGRNAGFSMTLFGFTLPVTKFRFGKASAIESHHYMEKAVDLVKSLVEENNIDCDYIHSGFLRVATSDKYAKRIKDEIELFYKLGLSGIEWIKEDQLAEQVRSPLYKGAWWEPRCGLVNPAKLSWGWKKVVTSLGVKIFERTPVETMKRDQKITLQTPSGKVIADKVVLATNAYSHIFPGMKLKQTPVFTHIILTEPLKEKHFEEIGWQNRQGIETARNLVHYYRLTKDNRVLMGGSSVTITYGHNFDKDLDEATFANLHKDLTDTFPVLRDVAITHKWGGPVSVTLDMTPAIGFLGDERVIYSIGCVGHGVSLTHLNGLTISELILGKKSDRTDVFFVNRKTIPWPPEPFRFVLTKAIKGVLDVQDKMYDPEV